MVCVGNICRSPSAEYIAKQRLGERDIQVHSAGISAMVGWDIDPSAKELLIKNNIACEGHKAQQISHELLKNHDLILVMEQKHISALNNFYPQASGKCFLLGKWQQDSEIPDPYGRSSEAFSHAYNLIEAGVQAWLNKLNLL